MKIVEGFKFLRQYKKLAGVLLFIAGVVAFMGIITAETTYPGYSTADNMISDLGATEPPNSIIMQPAATIFDSVMVISGILIILAAYLIHRAYSIRLLTAVLGLFGIGILGVGIFNGSYGDIHGILALLIFVSGAIAAIVAYKVEACPFRFISIILGAISLSTLILYFMLGESSFLGAIGIGGIERWIVYPVLLWVIGFGGHLMANSQSCCTNGAC